MTLDHKTSLKSDIFVAISNNTIVRVNIIDLSFMAKIISLLSKDHAP